MFWRKENKQISINESQFDHPYRLCDLYISERYHEILFIPYGKVDNGMQVEVDDLIVDKWPCKFEDLQTNIKEVLKRYLPKTDYIKGK